MNKDDLIVKIREILTGQERESVRIKNAICFAQGHPDLVDYVISHSEEIPKGEVYMIVLQDLASMSIEDFPGDDHGYDHMGEFRWGESISSPILAALARGSASFLWSLYRDQRFHRFFSNEDVYILIERMFVEDSMGECSWHVPFERATSRSADTGDALYLSRLLASMIGIKDSEYIGEFVRRYLDYFLEKVKEHGTIEMILDLQNYFSFELLGPCAYWLLREEYIKTGKYLYPEDKSFPTDI